MNTVICVELNHSQVEHNQICSNHDPRTTLPFCCEKYPTQYDAVQSFINGVFLITETSSQSSGPFIIRLSSCKLLNYLHDKTFASLGTSSF